MFLKIYQISLENSCVGVSFEQSCRACNFIKKKLQHSCICEKFAKFLRTTILKNIRERLLLSKETKIKQLVPKQHQENLTLSNQYSIYKLPENVRKLEKQCQERPRCLKLANYVMSVQGSIRTYRSVAQDVFPICIESYKDSIDLWLTWEVPSLTVANKYKKVF